MQFKCDGCRDAADTKEEAGICSQCEGSFCKHCCYYDQYTKEVWCFECSEHAKGKYSNYFEENEEEYENVK